MSAEGEAKLGNDRSGKRLPPSRLAEADSTVKSYAIAAMGLGLVPVPLVDVVGVIAVQRKMVHALTRLYGVKFLDNIAKTYILSLVSGLLPAALGTGLSSMVKMLPGVGAIGGAAGVSVFAGGTTIALGRVFTAHFESGGTLLDFKPERMRAQFRREFQRGRDEAGTLRRNAGKASTEQPSGA